MTTIDSNRAFTAFESQLRTLCLKEFPCGRGTWRESKPKSLKSLKVKDSVESKYIVTLKDYGASHEKTETLEEFVSSKTSPWHLDYSWSEEAKQLREIAVKSPWLIDDNFILSHFKTLRIVDKDVSEVDKELLKFRNLEELTLSANKLVTVNSKNLPVSLKVLELCANQISDLSALCVRPPLLIHLGLGMNKVSFIGDYITGDYWPNILSLDMSNNNLSDLLDVIRKLGTLPKLRNLILQGNPLALIAGYRGYTIDSLRKLNILDDIMISADEKHHYKGLARRREYILDEAKCTLEVGYIKGVPMPEEMKNPEEQPEFPIIERKYFVQFMFLSETVSKPEIMHISCEELPGMPGLDGMSPMPSGDQSTYSGIPQSQGMNEDDLEMDVSYTEMSKNVNFTAEPEVVIAREPTTELEKLEESDKEKEKEQSVIQSTPDPEQTDRSGSPSKEQNKVEEEEIKEAPINSEMGSWADDIQINWSQLVVRDDLLGLRNFFRKGMTVSVVEEMILSYPLFTPPSTSERLTSASSKTSKTSKTSRSSKVYCTPASTVGTAESKSSAKDKKALCTPADETPDASSPTGKKDKKKQDDKKDSKAKDDKGKAGKKKKEPELELKRGPPTYTTLASFHMPLEEFLEGEYEFKTVFKKDGAELAANVKGLDTSPKDSKKDKDKKNKPGSSKKDKSGKDSRMSAISSNVSIRPSSVKSKLRGRDGRSSRVNSSSSKDSRRASVAGKAKDPKGGKGKGAALVEEDIEEVPPPPPLKVEVKVRLHHWRTAMDSLKEEEERNKGTEEQM